MTTRAGQLPHGVDVVIRANAELPAASTNVLAKDLDRLLATVLRRVASQKGR
jgi:hypothetical protein